jgi:hypothetical protein
VTRWKVILRPAAQRQYRLLEEGPKQDAAELLQDLEEDPTNIPFSLLMDTYTQTWRAHFHHRRYLTRIAPIPFPVAPTLPKYGV